MTTTTQSEASAKVCSTLELRPGVSSASASVQLRFMVHCYLVCLEIQMTWTVEIHWKAKWGHKNICIDMKSRPGINWEPNFVHFEYSDPFWSFIVTIHNYSNCFSGTVQKIWKFGQKRNFYSILKKKFWSYIGVFVSFLALFLWRNSSQVYANSWHGILWSGLESKWHKNSKFESKILIICDVTGAL